jgi:hypothetical protein
MLSLLGVFVDIPGPRQDESGGIIPPDESMRRNGYGEAKAFRRINERLLLRAGADWDRIEPFLLRRDEPVFRRTNLLRMQIATFTGLRREFLSHALGAAPHAWGWKDPRNSVTLPYWLALFPESRVLHVRREPDKVVDSLIRRASAPTAPKASIPPGLLARASRVLTDPAYRSQTVRRRLGMRTDVSLANSTGKDPTEWRSLTDLYVRECERASCLSERYMEVQYETILSAPYAFGVELADFAGISPSLETLRRAANFVIRDPGQINLPHEIGVQWRSTRSQLIHNRELRVEN